MVKIPYLGRSSEYLQVKLNIFLISSVQWTLNHKIVFSLLHLRDKLIDMIISQSHYFIPQLPHSIFTSKFVAVFPGGACGKDPAWKYRRHKICEFNPWVGKIPWRREWQPTPVFLPGKFHGQRSLAGYSPQGPKE